MEHERGAVVTVFAGTTDEYGRGETDVFLPHIKIPKSKY